MSLFNWFSFKTPLTVPAYEDSGGLGHLDATLPMMPPRGVPSPVARPNSRPSPLPATVAIGNAATRKTERLERRELLYGVVRESMNRAGVLSASYKFKVLSLDPRGRQYLIMMDLANRFAGDAGRLAEIEALIAQHAKTRHDILVTAVYWRINEHVTAGLTQARPSAVAQVTPQRLPASAYEPLRPEEVAAFKKAITKPGQTRSDGEFAKLAQPVRSKTANTADFEDTELIQPGQLTSPLSATQYGDLN
ncbi:MAG: hypothetical protein RIS34_29 [Pseudomonadota bacterium]|jgi:hypothetical protein